MDTGGHRGANRVRISFTCRLWSKSDTEAHILKLICQNKKARRDYEIDETFEAGISLRGTEVKSLRLGKANLKDGYVRLEGGEAFLHGVHIGAYAFAHYDNHDPERERKLLLHKRELKRLIGKVQQRGFTLIPTKMYFKNDRIKVEIALAKGRKVYDKREHLKQRAEKRDMDRTIKEHRP